MKKKANKNLLPVQLITNIHLFISLSSQATQESINWAVSMSTGDRCLIRPARKSSSWRTAAPGPVIFREYCRYCYHSLLFQSHTPINPINPITTGVQRLRVQDTGAVLRDGLDPAACNRWQQATRRHLRCSGQDRPVQARVPVHLRLGDSRPTAQRGMLHQRQRALGKCELPPFLLFA